MSFTKETKADFKTEIIRFTLLARDIDILVFKQDVKLKGNRAVKYDCYKSATTYDKFCGLGGSFADLITDIKAGNVEVCVETFPCIIEAKKLLAEEVRVKEMKKEAAKKECKEMKKEAAKKDRAVKKVENAVARAEHRVVALADAFEVAARRRGRGEVERKTRGGPKDKLTVVFIELKGVVKAKRTQKAKLKVVFKQLKAVVKAKRTQKAREKREAKKVLKEAKKDFRETRSALCRAIYRAKMYELKFRNPERRRSRCESDLALDDAFARTLADAVAQRVDHRSAARAVWSAAFERFRDLDRN